MPAILEVQNLVKKYGNLGLEASSAIKTYIKEVQEKVFPSDEYSYLS